MSLDGAFYRICGWWYRWQACKLAAVAMAARPLGEPITPLLWSMTVFFEQYMIEGADATFDNFGPKTPVDLKAVDNAS